MNAGILFGVSTIQTRPPVLFLVIISWHGHDPHFVKKQSKIIKEKYFLKVKKVKMGSTENEISHG